MGLVGTVTGLPLLPLRGVVWLAEQLRQEALRQWTDPAVIRAELQRTHERWTAGEITAEERSAQEDALLARLLARSRAGITP